MELDPASKVKYVDNPSPRFAKEIKNNATNLKEESELMIHELRKISAAGHIYQYSQ
jgi:hypothetical protein